jgi:hypothetical protein
VYFVAFCEKQICQIRSVLAGDAGDECALHAGEWGDHSNGFWGREKENCPARFALTEGKPCIGCH